MQTKKKSTYSLLKRFSSLELITIAYAIITAIYIFCLWGKIENPFSLIANRLGITAGILVLSFWHKQNNSRILEFVRLIFPLILIMYWYPETYYLNRGILLPNLDGFFDQLDVRLFGFSPAMEFSAKVPQAWFSEIMYFAYFSYFIYYAYIICYFFFKKHEKTYSITFTILMSFFIFYIIFILIPVEGPQFFYQYPDNQVPDGYLFSKLMRFTQSMGEKPTAAFPSSHVGMTMIYLWILFRYNRKAFWIGLPVGILLFMSTVYIKAHYLVDVLGAFIMAPIICWASQKTYEIIKSRFDGLDFSNGKKEHEIEQ